MLGALIALIIWSRSSSSLAEPVAKRPVVADGDAKGNDRRERQTSEDQARPARPGLSRGEKTDDIRPRPRTHRSRRPVREYVNSRGILVRDFRTGDHPEIELPYSDPPRKVEVDKSVVADVKEAVYESVRQCRAQIDPAAFGDQSKAQAEILINIDEGQVTADKARVKLAGMDDETAGTELASCIQSGARSMGFAAEGHKKVSQYRVTLIFPLR